ncbi:hypothetical protein [Paenibacillus xylanilyticus]|uniref:hypothetical protein n=1 Tax=Paenibacillus xylanilyticus TaxID=248903 RepID=UPI003AAF4DD4
MEQTSLFELAQQLQPKLTNWRRDFHRQPEIGYEEVRTSGIVAEHLKSLGLEVTRHVGAHCHPPFVNVCLHGLNKLSAVCALPSAQDMKLFTAMDIRSW